MKTKVAKIPVPASADHEPTDAELRAIEASETETLVDGFASTPVDLARLGLGQIAYVRRTIVDAQPVWSIHSAMGHPLGAATTLEQAWGAIVQNNLTPVFVH